ncbi:hypothetical protein KP509_39G021800 [Ceratopteris richardii]|nr:hypothetical protein KP509_39G021800 [Ceratopteris richardii]
MGQCENRHDLHRSEVSSGSLDNEGEVHASEADGSLQSSVESSLGHITGHPSLYRRAKKHRLYELESVLLGPDVSDFELPVIVNKNAGIWREYLKGLLSAGSPSESFATSGEQKGSVEALHASIQSVNSLNKDSYIKCLLVNCAEAISEERFDAAERTMRDLKTVISMHGEPLERLAAYMFEGLSARLRSSDGGIYVELKDKERKPVEILSAVQKLYEISPCIKFAYMAANGAIAEAFKGESAVHIFDFQIHQGTQWLSLIQALASRPGGAPHIRISTIDDPTAQSYTQCSMHIVRQRLTELANALRVTLEFNVISTMLCELDASMIERRPGEVLAINFALKLHRLPDESVHVDNTRDRLLRLAKSLNPKVVTLVEQEANTNTAPFLPRFIETMDYYTAVFESIDLTLPRDSGDRLIVEDYLARGIINVIACEGLQRVERHELAGKWRSRMLMAGFQPHPLSIYVNNVLKSLLESHNESYKLREDGLILLFGWRERSLVAASAWH